jgi:hypothetical protein
VIMWFHSHTRCWQTVYVAMAEQSGSPKTATQTYSEAAALNMEGNDKIGMDEGFVYTGKHYQRLVRFITFLF